MRRRTVVVACGASLSGFAGCLTDATGVPTGSSSLTETPPSTPTESRSAPPTVSATPSEAAFRSVLEDTADRVVEFSPTGHTWHVEYQFGICCGEGFRAHQSRIARNFSQLRTGNVSLAARMHHECQVVAWRVPTSLAGEYERGEIDPELFDARVLNTTERTDTC